MTQPKSFACPHNDAVTILARCPIEACPFHYAKVSALFEVPEGDTACAFYDTTMMSNVSTSRSQISALSRSPLARVSSKAVRAMYDESLGYMRTLYVLTHQVPSSGLHCRCCGYPLERGLQCVSSHLCGERQAWTDYVISLYSMTPSAVARELIWETLLEHEINCPPAALSNGLDLLTVRERARYDSHGKEKASG